ncbi:MAG: efflux RND transporter permease subunit [Gemmataceae bacterium]
MIDHVIAFSVRRRWLVVLAAVILAIWGGWAALVTPIDAIPDLSENQVLVFTDWPGHGPTEIEDQVSYTLALELKGVAGVRVVRSSSDVGFSSVAVVFEDHVSVEAARKRVGETLARSAARFPAGASPRLGPDAAATGQIFWYTVEGAHTDPGRLRAIQDLYVRPQLAAVPGVAEVASVGGLPLEYQVELDPHRLRVFGIAPGAVAEAVARANVAVGGNVVHKGNAEYVARGVGWLGARAGQPDAGFEPQRVIRDLEQVPLTAADGSTVTVADVARVQLGSAPRRGVLEKDGTEATGGVVMMRPGENPLEVTRRLRDKILELQPGLPHGVRVVAVYDRTPLVRGAVGTVTRTLAEAILTATVCILLVLRHARTALVVAVTLPLAVLLSFGLMDLLRRLGVVDVQTNLMSLAGLAISVGVLVDSSIVTAENVMHRLKRRHGDAPVMGDTRAEVTTACQQVGRPLAFVTLVLLVSFLPVFALGGLEGKMFHPLAYTKSFAMLAVGLLSVTLVPALCTWFVRGRLRSEEEVGLVRGLIRVYRPVLAYLLDRPAAIVWVVGLTFVLGAAPFGNGWLLRVVVAVAALGYLWAAGGGPVWSPPPVWGRGPNDPTPLPSHRTGNDSRPPTQTHPPKGGGDQTGLPPHDAAGASMVVRVSGAISLVLAGLVAQQVMTPLHHEFLTPLDEGMVMDMPITVPRMSSTQAADDLRARDMTFCRFPEVEMVVGKVGRAESAADPAPLDMIETMIGFRPREFWPRRCLRPADAERQALAVLDALLARNLVRLPDGMSRTDTATTAAMDAVARFDAQMREAAYQRNKEFERDLGPRLVRYLVEQLLEKLDANGALSRQVAEKGLAPLADALLAGHAAHLAMDPTPEAVAPVVREVLRKLADLGAVNPAADLGRVGGFHPAYWLRGETPTLVAVLTDAVRAMHRKRWAAHTTRLNAELLARGAGLYTRLSLEALLQTATVTDPPVRAAMQVWHRVRTGTTGPAKHHGGGGQHHHGGQVPLPFLEPVPDLDAIQSELTAAFARRLLLWPRDRVELAGFGGELDRAMQMPGWTNVWTMPIQNRVDMLSTGVNTTVGVRVLGRRLEDVVKASEEIAAVLKTVPGAADVIADPVRGKGYLEVVPDREKTARLGVAAGAVTDLVEIAVGGRVVTTTVEGRERHPVRVRYSRDSRTDEEAVRDLPVLARSRGGVSHVPLSAVADVRITEGPAAIKGENGLLRNYVRLNVRGRDAEEFVAAARQAVAARVRLPDGVFCEWTGQFEHQARARRTLTVAVPAVVLLIFLLLWRTYRDLADAALMLLAVPGALAGGVILQWLLGYPLSVAAWVGFIACFGMATSTGVIMLVYLRQAVADAGGLEKLTPERLREVVLDGAAHRLRPKLLTEVTTLVGLAPLLLATTTGAEVLRPMVVPAIGGLLIADEVIDLFLPVLFYRVRLRRLHQSMAGGKNSAISS